MVHSISIIFSVLMVFVLGVGLLCAARPVEKREQADYVVSGKVTAVYSRETAGYREFIVEIEVAEVEKGAGIRNGDTFRAFCYQRKEGKGGLEFDTAGHTTVPKEGQQVKVFVKSSGRTERGPLPELDRYCQR